MVLLLFSCLPRKGKITFPSFQGATSPTASIYSISIIGSQMVINGANLESYNQVSILDPSTGTSKPFQVVAASAAQIFSESIDTLSLPMDKALDLILSSASAQQSFPITFTLQPNSVDSDNIIDGSIINDKIRFKSITLSKLLPDIGSQPQVGDYVRWNGIDFILDPAPPSGGGGGASGTVTSINTGPGLLSSSNPITTIGTISVDVGTKGAAAPTIKIPFFNNNNKIEMDSTGLAPDFSGLRFRDGITYFDIFNENSLKIQNEAGSELLILDLSGDLSVSGAITSAGSPVCTEASPCGAPPGSVITSVTVSPPLIASGTTDINISAPTGTSEGDLVLLGAPGTYPGIGKLPAVDGSALLGVINDVLPGTATTVSKFLGNATVGVLFGSGNAQRWQTHLDNLGTLNPNLNSVIIGNGTSFRVEGGDTLLTSIGAQKANANLTNLGNLSPDLGNIIVGGGASWISQVIPTCASGSAVIGDGTTFSCSPITWNFNGGTISSYNTNGMQLRASISGSGPTGELHFLGNNNINYVGFKAAAATSADTIWELPAADGSSGTALTTDGSGTLSWTNLGDPNNISNPATSTDNAIARFDGTTGKLIQNSGVTIDDGNNISNVFFLRSTGGIIVNIPGSATPTITSPAGGLFLNDTNSPVVGNMAPAIYFGNGNLVHSWMTVQLSDSNSDGAGTFYFGDNAGGLPSRTALTFNSQGNFQVPFSGIYATGTALGLGTTTPATRLDVVGSIQATGQITSGASNTSGDTVNWNNGNIISTTFNCASPINFTNLKIGGTYTLVVTDPGTTQCNFAVAVLGTDSAIVSYRFRPTNAPRIANTHSIYTLMRVGTTVYVSWGSGF